MSFSPPPTRRVAINGRSRTPGYPARELSPVPVPHNGRRTPSPNPPTNSRPKREVNNHNVDSSQPLIEPDANNPLPPIAGPEVDDLDSHNSDPRNPRQPGVDDGFFSNGSEDRSHPDTEDIPLKPKEPDHPDFPDETDLGRYPVSHPRYPDFPYAPGYEPGVYNIPDYAPTEFGGSETIPDVNVYQHKKTLAQGMMDLALFSANANQLRYVLESYERHPYYYPSIVLISLSLLFQVAVGVGLIWNAHYNVKDKREICIANKINNFTIIGIFLVTVINVFVSAFGVAGPPTSSPTK